MADRAQMSLNVALPQESTFGEGGSVTNRDSISSAQEQSIKIQTLAVCETGTLLIRAG